jgi:tetratricopeptide (TPR) repeat protein
VSGQLADREKALSDALKAGQLDRAAHVARSLGAPRYAARLFTEAKLPYQAAVCFYEAGESHESLESFLNVSRDDARYRRACVHAVRISSEIGLLTAPLDRFVDRFVAVLPESELETEALYRLGILYQENELFDHAREAFALVLAFDSEYADAPQRMAIIEPVLKNEALYRGMIRQDAHAWRTPRPASDLLSLRRALVPSDTQVGTPTLVVSSPPARHATSTPPSSPPRSVSDTSLDGLSPPPAACSELTSTRAYGDIALGSILADRYRIEEEIGQGGMGVVYRAVDLELDEAVAIKLFGHETDDPQLLLRFKQELSICRSLAHPNVIRHHDIGAHEGRKFISMELLAGASLRNIAAKPLPVRVALELLAQACAGLGAAHAQGIVHRDVKTDNLFVTTDRVVKLMDFGLAKRLVSAVGEVSRDVTVAGFIGGSPAYMAPEQIADFAHVGFGADIYSLGIVAYELLTGRRPFEHKERAKVFQMHMSVVPPPPTAIDAELPPAVDPIVMRCLEKDPSRRFPSCESLRRELILLAEKQADPPL